jgi:hypothetical protein
MKNKKVKASEMLKKLKTKRLEFAYGGLLEEIITVGSNAGGGGSVNPAYLNPPSGAYVPRSVVGGSETKGGSGYGRTVNEVVVTGQPIPPKKAIVPPQDVSVRAPVKDLSFPTGSPEAVAEAARLKTLQEDAALEKALADEFKRLNDEKNRTLEGKNMATVIDSSGYGAIPSGSAAANSAALVPATTAATAAAAGAGNVVKPSTTKFVGGVATDAPTSIARYAPPKVNLKQMEATKVSGYGATTAAKDIQKLGDATDATSGEVGIPKGYSTNPKDGQGYPQVMPADGKIFVYNNETGARREIDDPRALTADQGEAIEGTLTGEGQQAERYDATTIAGQMDATKAAQLEKPTAAATAGQAVATQVETAQRDAAAEKAAMGVAAERPYRLLDYAETVTGGVAIEVADIEGPAVITREGATISKVEIERLAKIAEGRGIKLEDLPEYKNVIQKRLAQQGVAATKEFKDRLGETPEALAARAEFTGAELTPEMQAAQIEKMGGFDAAQRQAVTSTGVGTTEAAQVEAVQKALAAQRGAITATDADKISAQQTDLESLPDYDLAVRRVSQVGTAANKEYADSLGIAPEEVAAQAEYYISDFTANGGPTDIEGVPAFKLAATRVAQTGEAATKIAQELGNAPSTDLEGRKAITGTVPQGDAAQIGGVPTMAAAGMQAVTGAARSVGAADMLAVVANVPKAVSAALAEDPAKVIAALDKGGAPNLNAAVAALPVEALVSTQMEQLLAGMEEGKTPAWARPAVAAIEQQMAQRGLSASTVGRDALFNAIIQSALPMAQSNAQALQQRASQNISNEQQVNLATAQNTMTLRLQNLANTQTSASQTAQMANELKLQQGSFKQQAVITSAEQAQQTDLANAQMAQQKSQQESAQRQQAAISTLSVAAQNDLANLQYLNASASQNMTAAQQAKLTSYNAQVAKVMRQADLKQDMEKANISQSLQIEMQRISELNAAAKDTMTAEQTERLTNLQTLIDFRKTDANFAQQMDMANMSNEQQIRLANLSEKAATDSANFTAENQFELASLNVIVDRNIRKAELEQKMKEVNLDANLKVELLNLNEKNATARANMTAEQQTRLANLNTLVDFRKV